MQLNTFLVPFISLININSAQEDFDYSSLTAIGSLEHPACSVHGVHIVDDYIYVLCGKERIGGHLGLFRQYERQSPFELQSLIFTFGIQSPPLASYYSETPKCFYVDSYEGDVHILWKIRYDDHSVTEFLRLPRYYGSIGISSDGRLFVLHRDRRDSNHYMCYTLYIYGPDAELKMRIELPFTLTYSFVTPVLNDQIFIGSSDVYAFRTVSESWMGVWEIDRLKDGLEGSRLIYRFSESHLNRTVVTLSVRYRFKWRREQTVQVLDGEISVDSDKYAAAFGFVNESQTRVWRIDSLKERNELEKFICRSPESCLSEEFSSNMSLWKIVFSSDTYEFKDMRIVMSNNGTERRLMVRRGFESASVEPSLNTIFSCMFVYEYIEGMTHAREENYEMVGMYLCRNSSAWCWKTVETYKAKDCRGFERFYKSSDDLFIAPSRHDDWSPNDAAAKGLVIHSVK